MPNRSPSGSTAAFFCGVPASGQNQRETKGTPFLGFPHFKKPSDPQMGGCILVSLENTSGQWKPAFAISARLHSRLRGVRAVLQRGTRLRLWGSGVARSHTIAFCWALCWCNFLSGLAKRIRGFYVYKTSNGFPPNKVRLGECNSDVPP